MFVIPMMGKSSRFAKAGYSQPKYMLPLVGETVFDHVVRSFACYFDSDEFVFVVPASNLVSEFVSKRCVALGLSNYRVLELAGSTSGQAETVSLALQSVPMDEPLYVYNADTFRPGFRKPDTGGVHGLLDVFEGDGEHWSFVDPGPGNTVVRTTEKERISDLCSDGLYYFASGEIFQEAYSASAESTVASTGETYIAPMYNWMIGKGLVVNYRLIQSQDVVFCGVPAEYELLIDSNYGR